MSQQSRPLQSVLVNIDNFSTQDKLEKLKLLAIAVVPFGQIENVQRVAQIFRVLNQCGFHGKAVPLLKRMLLKAGYYQHTSQLDEHISPSEESQILPLLYFHELLIEVADEVGNGDYLRKLVEIIPEAKIGVAAESIKSAVQLFQRLLHEQTINPEDPNTLYELAQWLRDIGRNDVAEKVHNFGTQVQVHGGLAHAVQREGKNLGQENGSVVAVQCTSIGQQEQCVTQGSSRLLEIHDEVNTNHGVVMSRGVERENAQLEDPQTTVQPFSVASELDGQPTSINGGNELEGSRLLEGGAETEVEPVQERYPVRNTWFSQHFTMANIGKALCCLISILLITILCSAVALATLFGIHFIPTSVQHLGYEGDTIVCDQTDGPWYTEWTVSEKLMQGDYNYDVQVCVVDETQLEVYHHTVILWNKNLSWPNNKLNLPPDLDRMPYELKGSVIKLMICLQSLNATTTPANVLIFDSDVHNREFLKSGVNHSVYSKNVPVGNRGQVKCSNVSYVVENPGYHYITLVKQGNVTIAENITIQVNYANISDCEGRKKYTVTTSESAMIAVPSYPATLLCYIPESPVHNPTPYTTHIDVIRNGNRIMVAIVSTIGAVALTFLVISVYCVVRKPVCRDGGTHSESQYGSID